MLTPIPFIEAHRSAQQPIMTKLLVELQRYAAATKLCAAVRQSVSQNQRFGIDSCPKLTGHRYTGNR